MHNRFLIFILMVTTILSVAAFYVGTRLLTLSAWAARHEVVVWTILILTIAGQFGGRWSYSALRNNHPRLSALSHRITYLGLGVFGCVVLYLFVTEIIFSIARHVSHVDISAHAELVTVSALIVVTVVIGVLQVIMGPRVYRVEVPLANLPNAFDGFRIVQITDVHLGVNVGRRFMRKVVDISNAQAPNAVVLTGDLVDGSVAQLRHAIEPIGEIVATHGVFTITGNHEYYSGADQWLAEYRRLGTKALINEHVVMHREGAELVLAGVTDYSTRKMPSAHASDAHRAVAGAPNGAVKILLAHNPASYKDAHSAGFDLQLSGHTHGGQFFPFSLLVRLVHRHYKGLSKHASLQIYVSRGTGYWGPPIRFGVPAEITVLTLKQV